jgi:DNA-binding CsgD family transcriptional regulator
MLDNKFDLTGSTYINNSKQNKASLEHNDKFTTRVSPDYETGRSQSDDSNSYNNYTSSQNNYNPYKRPDVKNEQINMSAKQNVYGKQTSSNFDYGKSLTEIVVSPFMGTDAYEGYHTMKRIADIVSSPASVVTSSFLAHSTKNKKHDYSYLNEALRKNGYGVINKGEFLSQEEFLSKIDAALKDDWMNINVDNPDIVQKGIAPITTDMVSVKKGKEFAGVHFAGTDNNLSENKGVFLKNNKAFAHAKMKDGTFKEVNLESFTMPDSNGSKINGQDYYKKFITENANKTAEAINNAKNIDNYIKNNQELTKLGIQYMSGKEIDNRISTSENGDIFFKKKNGGLERISKSQLNVLKNISSKKIANNNISKEIRNSKIQFRRKINSEILKNWTQINSTDKSIIQVHKIVANKTTQNVLNEGKGYKNIEFSKDLSKDLKNGFVKVKLQDGTRTTVRLDKINVKLNEQKEVTGKEYIQQYIKSSQNISVLTKKDAKKIKQLIANDETYSKLGLNHMTSSEIKSRLKINEKTKKVTFLDNHGKHTQLTYEQGKVIQDIAHHKGIEEAEKRKNRKGNKFHKVFKRESYNLIKGLDVVQGYVVIKKATQVLIRVLKAPKMHMNSKINKRRNHYEKLIKKGSIGRVVPGIHSKKLADHRTKVYNKYYSPTGVYTKIQKPISKQVGETVEKHVSKASSAIARNIKKSSNKVGTQVKNAAQVRFKQFRLDHQKFDNRYTKFSERRKNKRELKARKKERNAIRFKNSEFGMFTERTKGRITNLTSKIGIGKKDKKKNIKSKNKKFSLKWLGIGGLVSILLVIILTASLSSLLPLGTILLSSASAGGGFAAGVTETVSAQTASNDREIYNIMHDIDGSKSTADILGIMAYMKYKSNLNLYYHDDNNRSGLLAFDSDESNRISEISKNNGWGDPFEFDIDQSAISDDIYNMNDEQAMAQIKPNNNTVNSARNAQIRYIYSLCSDSNYPSVPEMSYDTMASQARKFATGVRNVESWDIETLDALEQSAIEMYKEYVMWDIEYLIREENTYGDKIANEALFLLARAHAGENVNMSTLYPNSPLIYDPDDWSKWYIKYVLSQTDAVYECGLDYIDNNCNNVSNLIEASKEKGTYYDYEETLHTHEDHVIKPGYIVIRNYQENEEMKYNLGIVLSVKDEWNYDTNMSKTTYTAIVGDSSGDITVYREDIDEITTIGSVDRTINAKTFTMNNTDDPITGFIAWYDPSDSVVENRWHAEQEELRRQEEERRRQEEEERRRQEEEERRQQEEANNSGNEDPDPDPEPEEPEEPDSGDDGDEGGNEGNEDTDRVCSICGVSESEYYETGVECDAAGGVHTFE